MIEYFVRPMDGIRYAMTFDELIAYRVAAAACASAPAPPGIVDGPIGDGTLDLPLRLPRARGAGHAHRSSSPSPARTCWPRR